MYLVMCTDFWGSEAQTLTPHINVPLENVCHYIIEARQTLFPLHKQEKKKFSHAITRLLINDNPKKYWKIEQLCFLYQYLVKAPDAHNSKQDKQEIFKLFEQVLFNELPNIYPQALLLERIFHQATTFEDHLVLYNREITRQQAILQATSFTEYVQYFQIAHRLQKRIGEAIPYTINDISEELLIEKSKTIKQSINDYYIENIKSVVEYILKSEYLLAQNPWPQSSFIMHFTTPTMENDALENKQKKFKAILLKLLQSNLISIEVHEELKGIYKHLLNHSINHFYSSEDISSLPEKLNQLIESMEFYSSNATIQTSSRSLSLQRSGLVKVLWYICEKNEDLIKPFFQFVNLLHPSDENFLLLLATDKYQNSALMISIKNNNYQAFRYIYEIIKAMPNNDIKKTLMAQNINQETPLMLAAQKSRKYTSKLLDLLYLLPEQECINNMETVNSHRMNPLMIAVYCNLDAISDFVGMIKKLPIEKQKKIVLQENSNKENILLLMLKHYKQDPKPIYALLKLLPTEALFQAFIGRQEFEKKQKGAINSKLRRRKRASPLKNELKSCFFHKVINEYSKHNPSIYPIVYKYLFKLVQQLPFKNQLELLNNLDDKRNNLFTLAFENDMKVAEAFLKYLESISFQYAYQLLSNQLPTDKDTPMLALSRNHPLLFINLITRWIKHDELPLLSSLLLKTNFHRKTFVSMMLSALSQQSYDACLYNEYKKQFIKILNVLFSHLSPEHFFRLLTLEDLQKQNPIKIAKNTDRSLMTYMISLAFDVKKENDRNKAIYQCLNVDLNHLNMQNNEVYDITLVLLQKLNKTRILEDRKLLTLRINPRGWANLSNALTFHPEKIIKNLKLYKEMKVAYAHIGFQSTFFHRLPFQKTLTDKIATVEKLVEILEKNDNTSFLYAADMKVLSNQKSRIHLIINAYNQTKDRHLENLLEQPQIRSRIASTATIPKLQKLKSKSKPVHSDHEPQSVDAFYTPWQY